MRSAEISVSSQVLSEFNTREASELHEAMNELGACGVGRIVNLPQIIVVGGQSSGKSSVLEALCRIRFPIKDGLCTRFATELVLRPSLEGRVRATVLPADKNKPPQHFQTSGFREEDLPSIIQDSQGYMELSGTGFSKDVLRLEIEGPNLYPLTLIDLPGLFENVAESQTLSDKETVNAIVSEYMKQPHSIILAVITADLDLSRHGALDRVRAVDPDGSRTIGVITKPDLALPGTAREAAYVKLASNLEGANKLELGWHAVRNRTELEKDVNARDDIEDRFFKNPEWASVPKQNLGISNLRKRLSRVSYDHIRKNLPRVIRDIESNLVERESELAQLGNPRSNLDEMRAYLIKIASEFQRLTRDGIQGRYEDAFFGGLRDGDLKFRALLRNFNRAFDHVLNTKGSTINIVSSSSLSNKAATEEPASDSLKLFLRKYPYRFPDPAVRKESEVLRDLQQQASMNQGTEFPGQPNKDLAIRLFQEQAKPWEPIAQFHVDRVTLVAKAFVDAVFTHLAGPPDSNRTTEIILSSCVDPFFHAKEKILKSKLQELLKPYQNGYSVALDAEFHSAFSFKSNERTTNRIYNLLKDKSAGEKLTRSMISAAVSDDNDTKDGEYGAQTVIDMMRAYYETARRTFAVNVINLAIESCLIADMPSILTPTEVSIMPEHRLRELTSESEDVQDRRRHLREDVDVLRRGLAICQKYQPRGVTAFPSHPQPRVPLSLNLQQPGAEPNGDQASQAPPSSSSFYSPRSIDVSMATSPSPVNTPAPAKPSRYMFGGPSVFGGFGG
ncbi:unnamed protein product [Clonostachys byssicola]|uniref:Interferon-induced GTP-binding protein Mx n=1 Tax=Clonostachys byssicola TaxID=160290 RepID=A0A9N9U3K1_9HYPO|nr:unnamed protein product [Clonostachys byssicola]